MATCRKFSWVAALCLFCGLAFGQSPQAVVLMNPGKGQIPNDTGNDGQTKMTIEKSTELQGDSLKVVFAAGDSFGDRSPRLKNWKAYGRIRFSVLNPGSPVGLEFNINHKRTFNYQTRAVHPIKLKQGLNPVVIDLESLANVNGSAPDLANIVKWYISCEDGKSPTLYFSDIVLEPTAPVSGSGAPAVPMESKGGTFRVRGTIGDAKVDLTVVPVESDSVQVSRAQPVAGDPARLARIRAATMPKFDKVISFDTPEADAILAALEVFPPDNPWNLVVSDWPLHPQSKDLVGSIGAEKILRVNDDMCFIIVPPNYPKVDVKLVGYGGESDRGPFPVPDNLPIEGWPKWPKSEGKTPSLSDVQVRPSQYEADRHAIIVDPVSGKLYEFFVMGRIGRDWAADQSSVFDLKSNRLRPDGWTSADAAGLPIFPAIIRYDELQRGEIEHAMRFTIRRSRKSYVYPATHHAGHSADENLPRMGERFRLKRDFDIRGFSPTVQTILKGLKKYGMFVADNGLEWSLSMAPDPRIPDIHDELRKIKGSEFEVVEPPAGYHPPD